MASKLAIVGISAELPSGSYSDRNFDHESFFAFLLDRGEAYERIPSDRFNIDALKGNGLGQIHVDTGAFLKGIDLFDNVEFGISSRDARCMAPVTRKLLEHSFLALLDSGINYRAKNVGCYTSGNSIDLTNVLDPDENESRGSFAAYPAMIANRISNHLDLLGPSLMTDTACSSSLTALHLAAQALLNAECEAAVVGGCQLNHRFMDWVTYSQGSILAQDGKCKPFDAAADGFSRAEGCVVIVLKSLEHAIRDHDHIYATILGTSINSTGSGGPPGAPVAESQRAAMIETFKRAGRQPAEVDYVELHATGTAKGDPTEANWVGAEFHRDRELLVGSVKGNIGHTEIAAFLASLSKVLSIFQHGVIPPNVNIRTPNPAIKWDEYNLRVPVESTPLPCPSTRKPLIAMASSGIGGSNGHVLLEGASAATSNAMEHGMPSTSKYPVLLMAGGLSARTTSSIAVSIAESLATADLATMSTVLGRRSKQMTWRSYAIASDPSSSMSASDFSSPQHVPRIANPTVMVFSGQGPQNTDMGRELFQTFSVFRSSILEMDNVYKSSTGKSIVDDFGLFGSSSSELSDPWPISLILPAIAMFQIALFDLLTSLGIQPDILVGHSAGETAVLYASGAAPKAMAVQLSILRGNAFSSMESLGGTMAALACSPEDASELLNQDRAMNPGCIVEIACFNSPVAVAIAGEEKGIERILGVAQARGIFGRKIRTKVPIHSSMMEVCRDEYCDGLRDLFLRFPGPHNPKIPTYSTLTGKRFPGPFDAAYFWNNTRSQVMFTDAINSIDSSHPSTFVEISPHPVLSSYVTSMVHESCTVLPTIHRSKRGESPTEHRDFLELCGRLTAAGHNCVEFTRLNGCCAYNDLKVALPAYPFQKKSYPLYPATPSYAKQMSPRHGPLNHKYLTLNKDTHPTIAQHIIRGEPIMPAAGFLEMAIEFGARIVMNVNLRSILSLSADTPIAVDVSLDGSYWAVRTNVTPSRSSNHTEAFSTGRLHADGYLSFEQPPVYPNLDIPAIRKRCHNHIDSGFYPALSYFSSYGPRLQRVTNVYYNFTEALASIAGLDEILSEDGNYILHPAILDACVQVSAYKPFHGDFNPNVYYLPARVGSVIVHQSLRARYFPAHIYAYLKLVEWTPNSMLYDVSLVDDTGLSLCTLHGLELAKHSMNPSPDISCAFDVVLKPASLSNDPPEPDSNNSMPRLYDEWDAFVFEYAFGMEDHLQWDLSGLNTLQELDIWILTNVGHDGGSALGLVRALRREYLSWTLHLVIFPNSYSHQMRYDCLKKLPLSLKDEPDIVISKDGDYLVPRITPLPALALQNDIQSSRSLDSPPPNHSLVHVEARSTQGRVSGVSGSVVRSDGLAEGSMLLTLTTSLAPDEYVSVDSASTCVVSDSTIDVSSTLIPAAAAACAPGLVSAVLAPGLSMFNRNGRLAALRILLTHSDTVAGQTIGTVYKHKGVDFSHVNHDVGLYDLSRLGCNKFDLIISGYEDASYVQILNTLVEPNHGRVFLWNDKMTGLASILEKDPCSIGDALDTALPFLGSVMYETPLVSVHAQAPQSDSTPRTVPHRAVCDSNKTYLILGGIGSIGVHLALFLYERGARHIVLTSRSGESAVQSGKNLKLRRMLDYLRRRQGLHLRIKAVDGTSEEQMKHLLGSLCPSLGGCIVLTAVLSDGTFQHLDRDQFRTVFASKIGTLVVLRKILDMSSLDLFVAFSSVSGLFGTGGQSNYSAANTLLEEETGFIPNGFSFICPGIIDSALMLANGVDAREARLSHFIEWSISAEDMMVWFEDALYRSQRGQRFSRYLPNLDWAVMDRTHGMTRLGKHLLPTEAATMVVDSKNDTSQMTDIVRHVLNIPLDDFSPEVPLTSYGIDSLSASKLSFLLRSMVEVTQIQLLADMSLKDIQAKLSTSSSDASVALPSSTSILTKPQVMLRMLDKYAGNMQIMTSDPKSPNHPSDSRGQIVILTGSTGALGSHILAQLIERDDIGRVYALNRRKHDGKSLLDRQRFAFETRGLPVGLVHSPKLVLVECDISSENFGIASEMMDELLSSVSHIIHNAWKVDFFAPLTDFEDLINGTRRLLDFAAKSKLSSPPSLSFISSIGVYQQLGDATGPEASILDPKVAVQGGYTESKWVGERLFQLAAQKMSLKTNVIRVGLLSGGTNGSWDTSNWVPALVQSGIHIGCLPYGDEMVSWLPVNLAASAIIEMRDTVQDTMHLIHPRPVSWSTVMEPVASMLGVPLVPYAEWFARLQHSGRDIDSPATGNKHPHGSMSALKLVDFYRLGLKTPSQRPNTESMGLLPKVAFKKGVLASASLRDARQLSVDEVEKWVQYWRTIGFLPLSSL